MNISCPYCNSDKIVRADIPEVYFNSREFYWNLCTGCKLIFILPNLSKEDLSILYSTSYHEEYYFKEDADYRFQIKLLKNYKQRKIADYGCGDAVFLEVLNKYGYQTTGVEYNPDLVTRLSHQYSEIKFLTVDQFWEHSNEKFEIIHLADVLEHMNDPLEILNRLKEKLSSNGIFFIEGPLETNPNLAYFFRKITTAIKRRINENKIRVREPYHVNFSNHSNQKQLFVKAGLELVYFKIYENSWPYKDRFKEIRSPWLFLQWIIVKVSRGVSSFVPNWGNRFCYIGKPVSQRKN